MSIPYALETFQKARRFLMLPHSDGIPQSIAAAFHECSLGLRNLSQPEIDQLDSNDAAGQIERLRQLMDTEGIDDPEGIGTWLIRAQQLTESEQMELSGLVDELASMLSREFWSSVP